MHLFAFLRVSCILFYLWCFCIIKSSLLYITIMSSVYLLHASPLSALLMLKSRVFGRALDTAESRKLTSFVLSGKGAKFNGR